MKKKLKENSTKLLVDQKFSQNESEYTVYDNLKVKFKNNKYDKKSIADKKVIIEKGAMEIYLDKKNKSTFSANFSSEITQKQQYKVAFNNSTKKFGILTGNAILKIDPQSTVQLPDNSFSIVKSYENMGLYIIKIPNDLKISESLEKIKQANPSLENLANDQSNSYSMSDSALKIEVIENFKSAM